MLASQLAADLQIEHRTEGQNMDLFTPVSIIVPNKDTGRWLTLQLAEILGIAANLEMILPAEWHWRQVRRFWPEIPRKTVSDLYPLYWALYERFQDPGFSKLPDPIAGYIYHELADSENLTSMVNNNEGQHFDTANHANADVDLGGPHGDNSSEQETRSKINSTLQKKRRRLTHLQNERASQIAFQIATLYDKYLNYRPGMNLSWNHEATHQKMSDMGDHERWQASLWRMLDAHWKTLYSGDDGRGLNKAELWEHTSNRLKDIGQEAPIYLFNPGLIPEPTIHLLQSYGNHNDVRVYRMFQPEGLKDDSLLQNLGKEIRKFHLLYDSLGEVVQIDHLPDGNTLLSKLKQIWAGKSGDFLKLQDMVDDESVQIRSCHSPLREMEVLHSFLLEQFEKDPNLHPDEILVVTPDIRNYMAAIDAVFGIEEEGIPAISHATGLDRSGIQEETSSAVRALLHLLDSRFEPADVVDLFSMNPLLSKGGVSKAQFDRLTRWLDENRIYWGLDEVHRADENQPKERLHTWREALRRIWFGVLTGGNPGEMMLESLVYPGVSSTEEKEVLGEFTSFLYSLESMVDQKKSHKTISEWCRCVESWFEQMFHEKYLQAPLAWLREIKQEAETAGTTIQLPYAVFKKRLLSQLGRESAGSAVYTKGILFNSMVPMRGIPYKIIAVVGLNDDIFPRKTIDSEFDLMAKSPKETDRDRRDEDRQMFLESIFAAQKIHYVSFVGQDIRDNEEKSVSTVISEWVNYLSERTGTEVDRWIKKESLSIFSRENFKDGQRTPVFSAEVAAAARQLHQIKTESYGFRIDREFDLAEIGDRINLDDLVSFYSNPYRQFVKKQLETSLFRAGTNSSEFDVNALETYQLFETLLGAELSGADKKAIHTKIRVSGQLPTGHPGTLKLQQLDELVTTAIDQLKEQSRALQDQIMVRRQPITFPVQLGEKHVMIDGAVPFYLEREKLAVEQSTLSGKRAMQHWVRHLACLINQAGDETDYFLLQNLKGNPKVFRFLSPDQAEAQFQDLVRFYIEFLKKPVHAYPSASYAYVDAVKKGKERSEALSSARNNFRFDDGGFSFGNDLMDPYMGRMIGVNQPFDSSFVEGEYTRLVEQMFAHLKS